MIVRTWGAACCAPTCFMARAARESMRYEWCGRKGRAEATPLQLLVVWIVAGWEQGFVDGEHVVDHVGGGEFLVDALAGGAADLQCDFGIAEDGGDGVGQRGVVVEFGEEAAAAVLDDFGEGAGAESDRGDGVAHCGEQGSAEAFEARGEGEEI